MSIIWSLNNLHRNVLSNKTFKVCVMLPFGHRKANTYGIQV